MRSEQDCFQVQRFTWSEASALFQLNLEARNFLLVARVVPFLQYLVKFAF
jgi:hypothetical protein